MNGSEPVAGDPIMDMREAALATGGTLHGPAVGFSGVTTDSRAVNAGDLFIALEGERFDGHEYVGEALRRGAVAAVTAHRVDTALPAPQLLVDDTRLALGRLASHWRGRFAIPLVALTGSNGKTTVKEMIAAILAAHSGSDDAVLATRGNLNNDIGMPLTLLGLRASHRFAVIEMGMNHAGEIDYLTRIARPTVALVNNAQRAHVGILGSVDAIARAKGEIYAGLGDGGIAIVNADDAFADYWKGLNRGRRVVSFALGAAAHVRGDARGDELHVALPSGGFEVRLQVRGEHNRRNALAACAAAFALDVPAAAMREALARFGGVPGRLQRRRAASGAVVIDDTYNANPESMKAALEVLAEEPGRKVFVMGDMGELGDEAPAMHAEIGRFAAQLGVDRLLATGEASRKAVDAFGERGAHFDAIDELVAAALNEARAGVTLLVKGSRFMEMERVAEALATGGRGAV